MVAIGAIGGSYSQAAPHGSVNLGFAGCSVHASGRGLVQSGERGAV